MKRAILFRMLLIAFITALVCSAFSVFIEQQSYEAELRSSLRATLTAAAETNSFAGNDDALSKSLSRLYKLDRVTIIRSDGKVLGDSEADYRTMENHKNRPEVADAMKYGFGSSIRRSATIGHSMLYVAVRAKSNCILRAAVEMKNVNGRILRLLPAVTGALLLALLIAFLLAGRLTRTFLRPVHQVIDEIAEMKEGRYDLHFETVKYDDLSPLTVSVSSLAENIRRTVSELRAEHDKIEFILNSIAQGIVIVEHDTRVGYVNRAACMFLRGSVPHGALTLLDYTHDPQVTRAVEQCLRSGGSSVFDLEDEKSGRILGVSVSPVDGEWIKKGAMLLVADVTQDRRSLEMRREFAANASHELKTPVTSIRGFAELISSGIVTDKRQIGDYIARIQSEAERMNDLISDILALSSLEENKKEKPPERVDVYETAKEVIGNLSPQAAHGSVSLSLQGGGAFVLARPELISRLLVNLVDNAVKYNRPGGNVWVTVTARRGECVVSVRDTGIGIPPKSIPRIFERFYRVDPGRSRDTGGTGLGLAIVKHIVAQLGGEISVTSRQNDGTEFIVRLPGNL